MCAGSSLALRDGWHNEKSRQTTIIHIKIIINISIPGVADDNELLCVGLYPHYNSFAVGRFACQMRSDFYIQLGVSHIP